MAFLFLPHRGRTAAGALAVFALLVVCFLRIPVSNDRNWQPEVAQAPYATVSGDMVTIHNVRNFDYRSETVFTPRWETRTYDLRKLDSGDLIAVYWAAKAIAHIMVSFGFGGRDYLAVSIETRKEKGESYSTLAGFFRQYELYYVVADDLDVIRVRTAYRQPQEDVYVYRTRAPLRNVRRIFLDYVKGMNELRDRPAMSWKVLLSGYVPDYLYELEKIDTTKPFAELEKLSRVNGRAHAADKDPAFSQRIREGLPTPPPWS